MWLQLIIIGIITWALWSLFKKPANYPPGPWGYPIIGYIPLGKEIFDKKLEELRLKHRTLFSWKIGSLFLVFIGDYKLCKELYQNTSFANRPNLFFLSFLEDKSRGIVSTNGLHWHEIRRFTLRHLRDLGMGKSKIVSAIQYECSELIKDMKKHAGKPAPLPSALTPAVINVLWQMVASKRYDFDDNNIISLHREMHEMEQNLARISILEVFPWSRSIVPGFLLDLITKKYLYSELSRKFTKRFESYIDEHINTLDQNNPRDYIDEYLIEMERQKENDTSTMSYNDLVGCIADLFGAGLETTTITIFWAVFYLAAYPEVQTRAQKEIDATIPNETIVSNEEKIRLPYIEAFISEVLRHSSLITNGVPHTVLTDVKVGDYIIPKDAIIFTTTQCIQYDKEYFESPNEFRPERFINSKGLFEAPKAGLFPFGIGKRVCVGESLARMELFIFLTSMIQNFSFSPPPNKKIDLTAADIPIVNQPKMDQEILITFRK